MRRRCSPAIGLALAAALLALSAPAPAAGADVAATRAYVQANYALVHSGAARIPTARAVLQSVLHRVNAECPRAAARSPEDGESTEFSNEVIGLMVTSAIHPDLQAIETFIRVAAPLRWSSHATTSAVQGYVEKLKTMAALAPPNVCADVRAWAARGYAALPADTVRFDQQFVPNWVALGELPEPLLREASPEEGPLLSRSMHLEEDLTEFEAEAANTWRELMNEFELEP